MTHAEYFEGLLEELKAIADDDESAHSLEDDIYAEFVGFVATGELKGDEAAECAKIITKTKDVGFCRWCA